MRKFTYLSQEAQAAAVWQAQHGYDGSPGTPLPELPSERALEEINQKPTWFRLAVHRAQIENMQQTSPGTMPLAHPND